MELLTVRFTVNGSATVGNYLILLYPVRGSQMLSEAPDPNEIYSTTELRCDNPRFGVVQGDASGE